MSALCPRPLSPSHTCVMTLFRQPPCFPAWSSRPATGRAGPGRHAAAPLFPRLVFTPGDWSRGPRAACGSPLVSPPGLHARRLVARAPGGMRQPPCFPAWSSRPATGRAGPGRHAAAPLFPRLVFTPGDWSRGPRAACGSPLVSPPGLHARRLVARAPGGMRQPPCFPAWSSRPATGRAGPGRHAADKQMERNVSCQSTKAADRGRPGPPHGRGSLITECHSSPGARNATHVGARRQWFISNRTSLPLAVGRGTLQNSEGAGELNTW